MSRPLQKLQRFFRELKRRNVYKVAATYAVVAFVGFQAAKLLIPSTVLPAWTDEFFLFLLIIGFPVALVVAWAFELTPEGVRRTSEAEPEGPEGAEPGTWTAYKVLVGLGLVAAAVAGGWYLTGGGGGETGSPAGERSVAVLPFEPLSSGEQTQTFARGIHDDLLTRLAHVSELTVLSRQAVEQYRESDLTTGAIADSLDVRWVVQGGVQKLEDQIQVNAQLVDPRTEAQRWADSYRRDLTADDLFALQSEITKQIARSLEARLTPQEEKQVGRQPTDDLDAYRLYVDGRRALDRRTEESMRKAVKHFRRALARDSTYALAWSGLADAAELLENYGFTPPEDAPSGRTAARRALGLAPHLAAAHASLAQILFNDSRGAGALRELRRAVELRPSYAQAHHWLGWLLPPLGRLEEAREHASLAVELNPRHSAAAMVLAEVQIAAGEHRAALEEVQRIRRRVPEYTAAPMNESLALHHLGRFEEAEEAARTGLSMAKGKYKDRARLMLAAIRAARGDTSDAREWVANMEEAGTSHEFVGLGLALTGETDSALVRLRREESWGGWPTTALRYWFPEALEPLRQDPDYGDLIREVNRDWGLNPDGSLPDSVDVSFETPSDD